MSDVPEEIEDEKVEHDGKLYLPVPHPLFDSPAEGSVKHKLNSFWKGLHFFLRGLYGTFVEWGVSWMDLVLEYPRVALAMLLVFGITAEETMAEKPMLSGTYHYVLYTMDPEAADAIFPPEATTDEAQLAVDSLAASILKSASEEYYGSPEYRALELQVQAEMHYQVTENVYMLAGMEDQLEVLRAARARAHAAEETAGPETPPVEEGPPAEEVPAAPPLVEEADPSPEPIE